jgi:hypothetical protein
MHAPGAVSLSFLFPRHELTAAEGVVMAGYSLRVVALVGSSLLVLPACANDESANRQNEAATSLLIATRALGVERPHALAHVLDGMPRTDILGGGDDTAPRLKAWQMFFQGSLLKLGRIGSATPLALHYNPFLDVAVLQSCGRGQSGDMECRHVCALPGEALSGKSARRLAPSWLSESSPLHGLVALNRRRIEAFEAAHPADAKDAVEWREQYCQREWQEAAELRVLQGLTALHGVEPERLGRAIAHYAEGRTSARANGTRSKTVDYLLANLSAFSISGTVELPDERRLLLMTPRASGWYTVAVLMREGGGRAAGRDRLLDATVLSFADEASR